MARSSWLFYALVAALTLHQVSCFGIIEIFSDSACSGSAKLGEIRLSSAECAVGVTDGCRQAGAHYNKITCPTVPDYNVSPLYHSVKVYPQNTTCDGDAQVIAVVPSAVGTCLTTRLPGLQFKLTETCSTDGQLTGALYAADSDCDPMKVVEEYRARDGLCQESLSGSESAFGTCSSTTPVGNAPISSPGPATGARVTKVYSDSSCRNQVAEMQQYPAGGGGCYAMECTEYEGRYVKVDCPASVDFTFRSDFTSVVASLEPANCTLASLTYAFALRLDVTCAVFPSFGAVAFADNCTDTLEWGIVSEGSCANATLDAVSATTCGLVYQDVLTGYHTCGVPLPPVNEPVAEPIGDTPDSGMTPDMTPVNGSPASTTPIARGPRSSVSGAASLTGTLTGLFAALVLLTNK